MEILRFHCFLGLRPESEKMSLAVFLLVAHVCTFASVTEKLTFSFMYIIYTFLILQKYLNLRSQQINLLPFLFNFRLTLLLTAQDGVRNLEVSKNLCLLQRPLLTGCLVQASVLLNSCWIAMRETALAVPQGSDQSPLCKPSSPSPISCGLPSLRTVCIVPPAVMADIALPVRKLFFLTN